MRNLVAQGRQNFLRKFVEKARELQLYRALHGGADVIRGQGCGIRF